MPETRRRFDPEFRAGAVRIVTETGKPIAVVARDLGIHAGTLGNWVKAARQQSGEGALDADERAELIRAAALPARVKVELANGFGSNAFFQAPGSDLVTALAEISGHSPAVADFGTNALRYGEVADQIVVFGPGSIDQAHQAIEWVEIAELERAADVYRQLFRR